MDMTATVPIDQLDWVKQNLPDDYKVAPYLGTYYYVLNVAKPPFKNNPNLRWALSLAINRQILTDKVTKGGQIPAFGWIPPGVQNYQPQKMDQAEMDQEQRERLARGMYRAAGYLPNNPLEVEILYNTSEGHKKIAVAIAAVALGAVAIEKHFTLDRSMRGPDHRASLDPGAFAAMVAGVRTAEMALGSPVKQVLPVERENRKAMRRSLVAARDIPEGTVITEEHLTMKRPGTGLGARDLASVVGRKARRDIAEDTLLSPDDLAE